MIRAAAALFHFIGCNFENLFLRSSFSRNATYARSIAKEHY